MQTDMPSQSESMPPPPAPPVRVKKFNGKVIGGLVLVLVALIFAAIALFGSWWSMKMTASGTDVSLDFGLSQYCATATLMGLSATACQGYDAGYTGFTGLSNTQNLMGLAYILVILGLIMAILTLVMIIVGAGKPKLKMAVIAFGIIGAIVMLVAFIYVFAALPQAMNDDMTSGTSTPISGFFGSTSFSGMELSWGGGIGWYMALIGFIMLMIGAIVGAAGMKSVPAPAPQPM